MKYHRLILPAIAIISTINVSAQRQPDLSLSHYWGKTAGTVTMIKDNDGIVIDGSKQSYYLQWRITNNGAGANDTIAISDTVKIQTSLGTIYKIVWGQNGFPAGMSQVDTVFFEPGSNPVLFPLKNITASQDSIATQWCDSVYWISGDPGNLAIDPDVSNNITCNNVLVTYWSAKVNDVISGNGLMLYPNPASGKLNLRYVFQNDDASVYILNSVGETIYSQYLGSNIEGSKVFTLDVVALPVGMYFLKMMAGNEVVAEKFYIQQ